ncbi:hypothetical protein ACQ86K_01055 [Mucilaginibacter sp. P19]
MRFNPFYLPDGQQLDTEKKKALRHCWSPYGNRKTKVLSAVNM